MAYDNTNSGVLFRNEKKETEKHPDYTGKLNINGDEFWLSAWLNEIQQGEKAGKKYFSIKVRPVESNASHQPGQSSPQARAQQQAPQYDDDIPF